MPSQPENPRGWEGGSSGRAQPRGGSFRGQGEVTFLTFLPKPRVRKITPCCLCLVALYFREALWLVSVLPPALRGAAARRFRAAGAALSALAGLGHHGDGPRPSVRGPASAAGPHPHPPPSLPPAALTSRRPCHTSSCFPGPVRSLPEGLLE